MLSLPRSMMATASSRANVRVLLQAAEAITASGIGAANQIGVKFARFSTMLAE
jgi:hypothetical protein